jgi:cullin 1
MMLYTMIYNMCTQKPPADHSEALYARYREAFSTYVAERVLPALRPLQGEALLRGLVARWANHKVMVRWLSRFFNYLDRYYIQRHNLHSLADVGALAFRDTVYAELKGRARDAALALVEAERSGERVDHALLRDVLSIFQEVGMGSLEAYERDFEEALLRETGAHYRRAAAAWIAEDSAPEYLAKAEERLQAEEARVRDYLHADTRPRLLKEAEGALLREHQAALLEKEGSGCAALLADGKRADLARMFRLFGRVPRGLEPMAEIFRRHVEAEGLKLVAAAAEAADARREAREGGKRAPAPPAGAESAEHAFVRGVVALHDAFSEHVAECFGGAALFHKALKEAFESACNKAVGGASVAELLAAFCDALLRKGGGERLGDEDLDAALDKAVRLLAYVSDRDLFSEFYRKRLGRRLLGGNSASEDAEKAVLTRLKQQCGAQFTSKMEGMVQDLQLAKEKERAFAEWAAKQRGAPLPLDLSVTVLTTGFWPTYKALELALPEEMMAGVERFSAFHDEASGKMRRLAWQLGLGTVHVRAAFDKAYELILSPSQAAVLLAFNDAPRATAAELAARAKVPEDELARVLTSFALGKAKLLLKEPAGRAIAPTDVFTVNAKFADRMRRVRVPLPPADDRRRVTEDVDKDRRHAIDAAIVRTMKSRRALGHQALVMEVVQQLSHGFSPDIKVVKRCIESLIEREYLERDAGNQQVYKYMA